uniref:Uncharacterized protein n=1 Tax=Ixodes ricinus TaxID=34613 RepID=A0A6B0UDM2_IXORI
MRTPPPLNLLPAATIFGGQSSGRPAYSAPIFERILSVFLRFLFTKYTLAWGIKGNKNQYDSTMPMCSDGRERVGLPFICSLNKNSADSAPCWKKVH